MQPDYDGTDHPHVTPLRPASSYSRNEIQAVLRDWARRHPPRRFALYRTYEDEAGYDGDVFAWGLAHDNYLAVRSNDERFHGRFVSSASLLDYFDHPEGVNLVWIDRQPGDC